MCKGQTVWTIGEKKQNIAKEYNAIYISNYQLFKENKDFLPNPLDIHPNIKGYQEMANKIMEYLETNKGYYSAINRKYFVTKVKIYDKMIMRDAATLN